MPNSHPAQKRYPPEPIPEPGLKYARVSEEASLKDPTLRFASRPEGSMSTPGRANEVLS